ncbi:RsiV family protein [Prevotella sp. 10(H)]|uniref:RsiV family protein n=1 Tax=Prevotella sp. 10(H) TaxID=1158294 RepID=UPI00056610C0|nr:RsiV family protein [Prevotella sp. 10(H)]
MKKLIYFFSIILLATACNLSNKQKGEAKDKSALVFSTVEYKEQLTLPGKDATEFVATIPVAGGENEAAKNINDAVFRVVRSIVGQEGDASTDYNSLFKGFITNYQSFIKDNPDYPLNWDGSIKGSVEYLTSDIANIKLVSYTMTGGAHGNPYTTSLLFNPQSGKELSVGDIVSDTVALAKIAENKFRQKYEIPADKQINSTGMMFLDNKFALPQNIFVTKDALNLFYNVYEIAPYADGTRELDIPYDEIKGYLLIKP